MIIHQLFNFTARDGTRLSFARTFQPPPTPKDVAAVNKRYKKELGVRVRTPRFTNEYNCHGLTFVGKLGWFDDVPKILKCHDYRKIGECANFEIDNIDLDEEVKRGDVAVYYDQDPDRPTHTGVIWSKRIVNREIEITLLSKWGGHSEYFHRHDKVPVETYGKSIQIWTDRSS